MTALLETLHLLNPISLEEMDLVKLLNRVDRKFCFHTNQLLSILKAIKNDYRVLTVSENRISRYQTLYFDTTNYDLYHDHQRGKLNRYKVRHRTYLESNLGFLEVKFKNNKGRTIKNRILNPLVPELLDSNHKVFIEANSNLNAEILHPAIWVNYNRITLVSKTNAERLTLDINLEYIKKHTHLRLDHLVIAEIKQDKKVKSPFNDLMKQLHIQESSVSKYSMGIAMTCNVKRNNFKPQLKLISTITHVSQYPITSP